MLKNYLNKVYTIVLSFSNSLLFWLSKLANEINNIEKLYYRGIINLFISIYYLNINEINLIPKDKITFKILIIKGILGGLNYTFLFFGINLNTLQVYTIIFSSNYMFSIIFSIIFLKKELSKLIIFSFLLFIIGIIITINPYILLFKNVYFSNNINLIGIFFGFMNSITYSLDKIIIKKYSKLKRIRNKSIIN